MILIILTVKADGNQTNHNLGHYYLSSVPQKIFEIKDLKYLESSKATHESYLLLEATNKVVIKVKIGKINKTIVDLMHVCVSFEGESFSRIYGTL